MGKGSKIGWTDDTFNIVWGCENVSAECDNCYAQELDARYHGANNHWGKNPRKLMADRYWREPLKWDREAKEAGVRRLVFCSSMADVFENNDQVESQRPRLWELIRQTPHLRWLLLTKRPQNIKRMLPRSLWGCPTVWLGTTIGMPSSLWRADALCEVPAPVHFLSMEPLIEQTSLREKANLISATGINWVITGCESGKNARPTPIDWYAQIRDECKMYNTDFYLKQAPAYVPRITSGPGSWIKLTTKTAHPDTGSIQAGVLEEPYLDGVQHRAFPV